MRTVENFTGNPTLKYLMLKVAEDGDTGTSVFSNFSPKFLGRVPGVVSRYDQKPEKMTAQIMYENSRELQQLLGPEISHAQSG